MKGTVIGVNYKRGLVAYEIYNGDCGYFETLDTIEFEVDDEIQGNLESLAGEKILKVDTQEIADVFIEDYGMTRKRVIECIMK